jgi:uncharacterized membrane protein (UPF0127 family)
MISPGRLALIAAIALACAACSSSKSSPASSATSIAPAASAVPTVTFAATTITWARDGATASMRVDVASSAGQSERGLGDRDALPENAGMLFDLHETRVPVFWMKGMRFALDMVWIGEDRRIASVTENIPPQPGVPDDQLARISPATPVRYVLELNAGAAARHGLAAGTQLTFDVPPAAAP